jgi:Uma2 family endonuclease
MASTAIRLTAEEFAEKRFELADGGRWAELVTGIVVTLEPPDLSHGNAVFNLTKAFGEQTSRDTAGYACYELGLIIRRKPDTVLFPAVSWFNEGPRFGESDKVITDVMPALVVEVASTNDRRRDLRERIITWHELGVKLVWVIDPISERVHSIARGRTAEQLAKGDVLRAGPVIEGFQLEVGQLFAEPSWWKKG